jgi:hypothetical protein
MQKNKTSIDSRYTVVEKDNKDIKSVVVPPTTLFAARRMGAGNGARGKGHITSVRTRLAVSGSVSSAAAGALSTVITVDPSGSTEWASFQNLFDEVKVHGGVLHWHIGTTGGTPTDSDYAIAYDPTNGGAYTSVVGVLVTDQCQLTRAITQNAGTLVGPNTNTKSGFWTFKFKCPEGSSKVASNVLVDAEVCTGLWADTTNSVTPKYGFIKPYAAGAGGSVVQSMYYYLVMDVEFRSRS